MGPAVKRPLIWKLIGVAGLAGVAATGVAVARSERQRRSYTPEDVRARLQDRLASIEGAPVTATEPHPRQPDRHLVALADHLRAWRASRADRGSHRD